MDIYSNLDVCGVMVQKKFMCRKNGGKSGNILLALAELRVDTRTSRVLKYSYHDTT